MNGKNKQTENRNLLFDFIIRKDIYNDIVGTEGVQLIFIVAIDSKTAFDKV